MTTTAESQLISDFNRDGAVFLPRAFDASWVELARRGIERNLLEPSPLFRDFSGEKQGFLSDMWSRRFIPELDQLCRDQTAARLAARLFGTVRVRLLQDVWFFKQAGTAQRTPWHHDAVISGPFCSIWVALDPTPREATVEFIAGSHRWGEILMPHGFYANQANDPAEAVYTEFHDGGDKIPEEERFAELPDIDADRAAYNILGWDMEPGDCVIFDARTVHGAPGNTLSAPIRRFVTRWVTDDSVINRHGAQVIGTLTRLGLDVDLAVGKPVRGELFPTMEIADV